MRGKYWNWTTERKTVGETKTINNQQLWNTIKWFNSHVIAIPEEVKRENTEEIFEEKMAKNFPQIML